MIAQAARARTEVEEDNLGSRQGTSGFQRNSWKSTEQ
jgi:hypothetical protein